MKLPLKLASQFSKIEVSRNDTVRNRCAVCQIGTMNFQALLSSQQSNDFLLSQCDTINGTMSIMRFDGY